ncbi:JmjC domain-containing protein [Candidatus Sororendozoicomonas aggregata]|uniref:JmjC domain-containing protein n=1 Tax=Candidatus Sororendozoicomonas aggregata TaxID=3073239 RepID=UPI002ED43CBF
MKDWLVSKEDFESELSKKFEKAYFLKKNASKLHDYFSCDDAEAYLKNNEGWLQNILMLYQNGQDFPIPANLKLNAKGQFNYVLDAFKSGATLKLEELEKRNFTISEVCRYFENIFGGKSWCKAFWTSFDEEGVPAHFDTTSIVVVQIDGAKVWQLWDGLLEMPNSSMAYSLNHSQLGKPKTEVTLEAGDILYLPAGVPHAAKSVDNHSLHLGFAIEPISYLDVLVHGLKLVAQETPELRKSIIDCAAQNESEIISNFLSKIDQGVLNNFFREYKFSLFANYISTTKSQLRTLSQAKLGKGMFRRTNERCPEIKKYDDEIKIAIPSQIISEKPVVVGDPDYLSLPLECAALVDTMLNGDAFVPELLESEFDESAHKGLVNIMLDAGLITVV